MVVAGIDGLNTDSPIVGYQNLVTVLNITATTEDIDFPASNLANPATHLTWKQGAGSPSSDEYLTVTPDTPERIDYLAIAAHNFGTNLTPVSVEGVTAEPGSPADWFELITERLLPDDGPVIFRFNAQALYAIRLRIQASQAAAPVTVKAGVLYVGELLTLQRRIYVGHTPMKYGRKLMVSNLRSVSGAFLGRIVTGEKTSTNVALKNLTPDWYRSYMEPFLIVAKESPFFFAWRPGTYPNECGYCWLADDPVPANQLSNGMMQINLDLEGIV